MSYTKVTCTQCSVTRYVTILPGGLLYGDTGDTIIKHAYKTGHILKIGNSYYKSQNEHHLVKCEAPQ